MESMHAACGMRASALIRFRPKLDVINWTRVFALCEPAGNASSMKLVLGWAWYSHNFIGGFVIIRRRVLKRHQADTTRSVPATLGWQRYEAIVDHFLGCDFLRDELVQLEERLVVFGSDVPEEQLHDLILRETASQEALGPRKLCLSAVGSVVEADIPHSDTPYV